MTEVLVKLTIKTGSGTIKITRMTQSRQNAGGPGTNVYFTFNTGEPFEMFVSPSGGYKFTKFCLSNCAQVITTNPYTGTVVAEMLVDVYFDSEFTPTPQPTPTPIPTDVQYAVAVLDGKTGAAIQGAVVTIGGQTKITPTSGETDHFTLTPNIEYLLQITKTGYKDLNQTVRFPPGSYLQQKLLTVAFEITISSIPPGAAVSADGG